MAAADTTTAPLRSVKFVLLLLEKVSPTPAAPTYAKITRRTRTAVFVRGLSDAADMKWTIKPTETLEWAVEESHVLAFNGNVLERSPVLARLEQEFLHGQAISTNGQVVVVRSGQGDHEVPTTDVAVVKAVVAVLLQPFTYPSSDWMQEEIIAMHTAAILRGFVEESDFPSPETSVTWVNPKTGNQVAFSLRHAVEYTRFIDGGLSPVPATVGTAFYLPPPLPAAPAIRTRTGTLREATSQMFELEDDDDAILDEVEDQRPPAAPVVTTSDNQPPASNQPDG
ncbi:hypothetical protein V7S43_007216 [Phytophthora oleae]|uniref:Uncharacterized protein n=1 Tax=Phytophthora oleae TaxID=2107226 RepID=A0ABD3FLP3_9STRA